MLCSFNRRRDRRRHGTYADAHRIRTNKDLNIHTTRPKKRQKVLTSGCAPSSHHKENAPSSEADISADSFTMAKSCTMFRKLESKDGGGVPQNHRDGR